MHINVGTAVHVSFITGDICNQFDDCYENLVFHVVEMDVITRYMGQKGWRKIKQ
jgi:hypothetical protein